METVVTYLLPAMSYLLSLLALYLFVSYKRKLLLAAIVSGLLGIAMSLTLTLEHSDFTYDVTFPCWPGKHLSSALLYDHRLTGLNFVVYDTSNPSREAIGVVVRRTPGGGVYFLKNFGPYQERVPHDPLLGMQYGVRCPTWVAAILFNLLSLIGFSVAWNKWKQKPLPGTCLKCGYDMRATPDRCPECGEAPSRDVTEVLKQTVDTYGQSRRGRRTGVFFRKLLGR